MDLGTGNAAIGMVLGCKLDNIAAEHIRAKGL